MKRNKKYILGFIGSPRIGGNTDFLLSEILRTAHQNGALVEKVFLSKLKIAPCQACDFCKKHVNCQQNDDMQGLYRKIQNADGLILGTPAYFGQVTAQMKTFIDRLYAFYDKDFKSKIKKKKRGAFVFIWAEISKSYAKKRKPVVEFLGAILDNTLKAKTVGRIVSGGIADIGDAAKNKLLVHNARQLGKKILGS